MRSFANNRHVESSSFWDQLENDIDKMGNRARDKLMKYQIKQFQTIKNNNPQSKQPPTPTIKLNIQKPYKSSTKLVQNDISSQNISTLNRRTLEKLQKEQSDKKLMMKNRLMYLNQDKQKKNKTIQMARRKYQIITTVRNQNFKQKQLIRKRILSIDEQIQNQNFSLAMEVKSARDKRHLSLQNYKSLIQESAEKIRNQSIKNQSLTAFEKAKWKQQNIKKASLTKKDLQRSRSLISQAKQRKVLETKNYQKQQLANRLKNLKFQKKSNQQILTKLKHQTQKIGNWKTKAQKQIQQYRSYLGTSAKNSFMFKPSLKNSENGSTKSFYITHF